MTAEVRTVLAYILDIVVDVEDGWETKGFKACGLPLYVKRGLPDASTGVAFALRKRLGAGRHACARLVMSEV